MSLRALKSFVVVLSLVACANEMQEIGAPSDESGGSGSGAAGGDTSSGGSGSGASGGSGSGSGSTGGTSSTGSGGKGGSTGAFGGSAGVTGGSSGGSGGASGGSGGTSGAGGAAGGASGSGGSGGSGTPTGECATMTEWVAGKQLTAAMAKGDELTYNDKVFTYAGDMPLWNFEAKCPPEGTREAWCDQTSSIYKYTLVGPCE